MEAVFETIGEFFLEYVAWTFSIYLLLGISAPTLAVGLMQELLILKILGGLCLFYALLGFVMRRWEA